MTTPGIFQPVQVTKQPQRIQSLLVAGGSFLLVNPDITNNIFVGNDPGSQTIPVPPLGSVALTLTNHDLWVSTNGGNFTVNAFMLPGGSQWTPSPAQVAAQISALGLATAANQNTYGTAQATATNQSTQITGVNNTNGYLGGTTAGALVANTGKTVSQELAALQATGSATGPMGGIPLLRFTQNLGSGAGTSPAPGGSPTTLISAVSINQPGLEAEFTAHFASGTGTSPFIQLVFQWSDKTTGYVTWTDYFYIPGGNGAANAITCYINGPCYGTVLTVTAINTDATAGCALDNWVISQTSHVYERTVIKQAFFTSVNGFLNPDGFPASGILCSAAPSVGFGTSTTRLLPVWSGRVGVNIDNLGGASAHRIRFLDPTGVLYSATNNNKNLWGISVGAGGDAFAEIALPQGPVTVELHNSGSSGSEAVNCVVTRMPY